MTATGSETPRERALRLWDTTPASTIARALGVPVSTVCTWAKRAGKPRKPRGRPRKEG